MPRHSLLITIASILAVVGVTLACSKNANNEIVIVGDANYRERVAAPESATFEAVLVDITDANAPVKTIASYKKDNAGQPPYAYRLSYQRDDLKHDRQYVLRANLSHNNTVLYTTQDTYSVKHGQAPAATSLRLVKTGNVAPAVTATEQLKRDAEKTGDAIADSTRELGRDVADASRNLADKAKVAAAGAAAATKAAVDDVKNSEIVKDTEQAIKDIANRNLHDTYWRLASVPGVTYNAADLDADAHLVLHKENSRLAGSDGCNTLTGKYALSDNNGVRFSEVIATEKSCAKGKNVAGALSAALTGATRYTISGNSLTLHNAAGTAIASFNAVDL